jgi:hypothetical protein
MIKTGSQTNRRSAACVLIFMATLLVRSDDNGVDNSREKCGKRVRISSSMVVPFSPFVHNRQNMFSVGS